MAAYQFVQDHQAQKKKSNRGCCSCLCGILRFCFGCLFKICWCWVGGIFHLVCQIICTVLVIAAIIILILWLLFRPENLQFHVGEASLAEFNLQGNTLRYDLVLNVSARNPNSRLAIIYENIEALAFYHDQKFAAENVPTFSQETKSTHAMAAEFRGQNNSINLGDEARANYDEERSSGEFSIDVKVQLKIKLKLWLLPSPFPLDPSFDCDLNVPLNSSGKPFQGKDCSFNWHKIYSG